MKVRTLKILAAAFGISLAAASAAEPAKLKLPALDAKTTAKASAQTDNQKLADVVSGKLAAVPAMQTVADLQLFTEGGAVTVTGTCKDAADKKAILDVVSKTDGVKLVKDGLKVSGGVKQTQAIAPPAGPRINAPMMQPPAPMPTGGIGGGAGPDIEPLPLGPAGGGMQQGPPLPNHAWPTYAPYPNMSRVAYPSAYPYNAFPYIGPYYPFPKVPLGWRSVTLSWEDGHWWLGRKQTPQDYWRVKFGY